MSSPIERSSKRSTTVALVLVASAGATAFALGRCDPSQREEDVLVYRDPDACIRGGLRTEDDCRNDYATALAAYPEGAPRYPSRVDCEGHHGAGHCVDGTAVAASAAGSFVPILAGYAVGRLAEQALAPQPLYDHRPDQPGTTSAGAGGGGYCTSWGGRVVTGSGGASSSARVSSAAVRPAAFGGFGATGRNFAAHGMSGHGSGG